MTVSSFSGCCRVALACAARRRWLRDCTVLGLGLCVAGLALAQAQKPLTVLVVGDSLSAEYGLQRHTGWVALLTQRLQAQHPQAVVVNASISGDTTSGGRSRLPSLLNKHQPTHVLLELGGNDALRGLPLTMTEANLTAMTQAAKAAGAKVTLLGMQMPPNYGAAYTKDFQQLYANIAKAQQVALAPFFLKNVADAPNPLALFQADRIHPNETAQALMLDNVWPVLLAQLKELKGR